MASAARLGDLGMAAAAFVELDVPLPAALGAYASTTRLCLVGPEDGPLLVLLGGISGNRYPALRAPGVAGWWTGLADPDRHRILGIDFVADEEGRRAPSTAEQALVIGAALDRIGAERADAVIGASYGGMVALAFAERAPERIARLVLISADAAPHPCATAMRELQRRVVRLGLDNGEADGALAIARGMAMLTYRCPDEFAQRFEGGIASDDPLARSAAGAYLHARGEAFRGVMSPGRFLSLSASIDRHRVDPAAVRTPTLLIGADSDQLVLPSQMKALAAQLSGPTELHMLPSLYGHDMFLKDVTKVSALVARFLEGEA